MLSTVQVVCMLSATLEAQEVPGFGLTVEMAKKPILTYI